MSETPQLMRAPRRRTNGPADGVKGAAAEQIVRERPGSILASQFQPGEHQKHEETTGPEIWGNTDGNVDGSLALEQAEPFPAFRAR